MRILNHGLAKDVKFKCGLCECEFIETVPNCNEYWRGTSVLWACDCPICGNYCEATFDKEYFMKKKAEEKKRIIEKSCVCMNSDHDSYVCIDCMTLGNPRDKSCFSPL